MGEPERAGTVSITTQVDQILKRIGANSKVGYSSNVWVHEKKVLNFSNLKLSSILKTR